VKSVALVGPLAADANMMLGSWVVWAAAAMSLRFVPRSLKNLAKRTIHYAKGSEISTGTDAQIKAAVEAAKTPTS